MNLAILCGRLTKDIDLRYSQGNSPVAIVNFSLAVDRRYKREGDPDCDFFNCTAFGKTAEFMEKYLMKGSRILVSGRLQNDSYTNKEGQKVTATKVLAESVEFADGAKAQKAPAPVKKEDDFMAIPDNVSDEELPFNFDNI